MSTVTNRDKRLYNSDLAPTQDNKKTNEMKMNGITSSGDDFSHGKCRKN